MTKISVPVPVTVNVEIDFPDDEKRFSIPGFHMEYATINDETCDVNRINVSAVLPSVYWLDLRRAPEPFAEKPYRLNPEINFQSVLTDIVNRWPAIMNVAMEQLEAGGKTDE